METTTPTDRIQFEYLEAYRHNSSNNIVMYPLKSFEIPLENGVNTYMTFVFRYVQPHEIRRTYSILGCPTDVISRWTTKEPSIFTSIELLERLLTFGEAALKDDTSNYLPYKVDALTEGINKMIIRVANEKTTRMDKIKNLKMLIQCIRRKYNTQIADEHLDTLFKEEADFRYYTKKANLIKNHFREAISTPSFVLCKNRLMRECQEMEAEI